jgi:hypothetical protein
VVAEAQSQPPWFSSELQRIYLSQQTANTRAGRPDRGYRIFGKPRVRYTEIEAQRQTHTHREGVMFTIEEVIGPGKQGYAGDNFEKRLLEICDEHQKDNRALIFAFLVYNFEDAAVTKVVKDRDYWTALNKASGSAISIFSLHSPTAKQAKIHKWSEEALGKIQKFVQKHFGSGGMNDRPGIFFFQVSGKKLIDSYFVGFSKKKLEDVFEEMLGIVKEVASSLEKVEHQNRGNAQEVFYLVEDAMKQRKLVNDIVRGAKGVANFKSVAKAILGAFA